MLLSKEERTTYNHLLRQIEVVETSHRGRALEQLRVFVEIIKMSQSEEIMELFE
jgi:hypothetical protein